MSISQLNNVINTVAHTGGKRLIVLGAGLSGLSYVHYIRNFMAAFGKDSLIDKITILEANDYMGGSVKSNRFSDGSIHELGPRSIRTAGVKAHNTVALLEQLGLEDKILSIKKGSVAGKNRFIYNNERLWALSTSLGRLFRKLPNCKHTTMFSAIRRDVFGTEPMDLSQFPEKDPSLYEFVSYRFGEEAAEMILDPVMRGIFAGDCRQLSTRSTFPDLLEKEQLYGSVLKGSLKPPVTKMPHDELFPNDILKSKLLDKFQAENILSYNLTTGLQTIPEYLTNSLLNTNQDNLISIYNQTKVMSLEFTDYRKLNQEKLAPCSVIVQTVDGDQVEIEADHIISTIPAKDLTKLLKKDTIPASSQNQHVLDDIIKIPHSPVCSVCVEYRELSKAKMSKEMQSFGFLTHSKAGSKVLGIAFDTAMFPEIDVDTKGFRMTAMMGGSWFKEIFGTDELDKVTGAQMEQIALEEIRKILKIHDEPYRVSSLMWKSGIAQYTPGHKERLQRVREELQNMQVPLTLLGQSYDGVAVNDVIFASRMAAYNFVKALTAS